MEIAAEKQVLPGMDENQTTEEKKDRITNIDFKMVTFSLAGKDYAVDIMNVKEIAKAGRFTFVPNTSPFVLGVYNLRGDIIPIVDLRLFFNIEVAERLNDEIESMIIVTVGEQTFGVVVDGIDKVVGISRSTIQPPHPLFGDISIKYIYGVVESNRRLYILLDIERIFGTKTAHQEETAVSIDPVQGAVPQVFQQVKVSAASVPAAQKSGPVQAPVPAQADVDMSFIFGSLKTLKQFTVTDINSSWVNRRFKEWKKLREGAELQLISERDAEIFLETFFSPCTGSFWTKEYADAIYKILPENTAKQIHVWNPGCGKGYESYSLACLLKRRYPESRVRIYAHDIDLLNISNAPLLTIPNEAINEWYQPYVSKTVSGAYTFSQDIKDMVLFEYHDCVNANAMPNIDCIFCRDLLSFLPVEKQQILLEDFSEKLKGNGVLISGENEIMSGIWNEKMVGKVMMYTKE